MHIKLIGVFVALILCLPVSSQYVITGQDPASTKWSQIKTDHFQIIYPQQNEENGQDMARKLEAAYDYLLYSLHAQPRQISVILHSASTYSNALNGWAPRRIEIWPLPDQETYGQDWLAQLAIHELRHTVQVEKMNQGLGEILSLLLGEQSQAATIGLFVPFWYLEGDAVVAETALSNAGRGRVPSFTQELRALVLEKGIKKYDNLLLGSYKTFIPNHYVVGYHAVAINRCYKGAVYYDKKLNDIARYSAWRKLFSGRGNDMRDRSKIKHVTFAIHKLDSLWRTVGEIKPPYFSEELLSQKKGYHSYINPIVVGDTIWALENSLSDIPQIVGIIHSNIIKRIPLGNLTEAHFGANNDFLVWSERIQDKRWQHRTFNDLILYSIRTGKTQRITKRSRFFHPVINVRDEIAAVEVGESGRSRIVILNTDGETIGVVAESDNGLLMQPCWDEKGESVAYIKITNKGKVLYNWNADGNMVIRKPALVEISHPAFGADALYYTVADSGMNVIHRFTFSDSLDVAVLASKFGVDYPAFDFPKRHLIYADYTSDGYKLKSVIRDSLYNVYKSIKSPLPVKLPEELVKQEKGVVDFDVYSDTLYISSKYSKWNLIGIHSWFPFYMSSGYGDQRFPGVYLLSQNKLSNTVMYAGYNGDSRQKDEMFKAGLSFRMFFPVFDFEYTRGLDEVQFISGGRYRINGDEYLVHTSESSSPIEKIKGTLSFPLNVGRREWSRRITPYVNCEREFYPGHTLDVTASPDINSKRILKEFGYNERSIMSAGVLMYNYRHESSRDLFPKFGQKIRLVYKESIGGNSNYGSMSAGDIELYFPGILKNHHLSTYLGGQIRDAEDARLHFLDYINTPRGENSLFADQLLSLSTEYHLPVLYPDMSFGWLVYIKRIGLSSFFDYSNVYNDDTRYELWSTGGSVWGDFYFLRYELPMRLEIRSGFAGFSDRPFSEVLFSISIF